MTPPGLHLRGEGRPALRLHLAAILAAVAFFALIVLGGGVGEPQAVVPPPGPLTLGLLGITLVMALGLQRQRRNHPNLVRAAWTAAALAGGDIAWTALSRAQVIPAELMPLKDAGATALFVLLVYLVAATAPVRSAVPAPAVDLGARRLTLVAGLVLATQMAVGAVVRYSLVAGVSAAGGPVLLLHRVGSLLTLGLVIASATTMYRATARRPWLRGLSLAVVGLVMAQAILGAVSASAGLTAASARAHIGVGVALLAAQWGLYVGSAAALSGGATTRAPISFVLRQVLALAKARITFMVVLTFAGGVWLSPGTMSAGSWWLTLLGTVAIVAAANALNMYRERDIDGRMHRTRNRPLPAARLSPETALGFGTVMFCVALPLLLAGSNALTAGLGLLAFASYVFVYTPMKQMSSLALFVGAVPGALPPLMGWTAARNSIDLPGLLLFAVLFAWQIPHFLAIAEMRGEEYSNAGIKVMPVEFGMRATRLCSIAFAVLTVGASLALWTTGITGWPFALTAWLLGVPFITRSHLSSPLASASDTPEVKAARLRWARRLFGYSIVYLSLLMLAMGLDRGLLGW